jgi:hypothetical protein
MTIAGNRTWAADLGGGRRAAIRNGERGAFARSLSAIAAPSSPGATACTLFSLWTDVRLPCNTA